jgi:hypothetical protein
MNKTIWLGLTLLGACVLATTASAGTIAPAARAEFRPPYLAGNWGTATFADGTRSDYRRYYRRPVNNYDRGTQGWFDVRGGFFDTQDVSRNDWTAGVKAMGKVTPQLSLGLATDLHRRTHADRIVSSQYTDPTGHVVTTSSTADDAESNLVPIMGVLELHVPSRGADPYFGAAAGWEFLNVHVRDFQTGIEDEANYDGPGFQAFGGIAFPIGDRARFTTEAYWNGATVKRDVRDFNSGTLVEERIDVNGVGARAGLGFAF